MAAVAEFDEKLNSILGNPDAMAQIMQLAQSLSGGAQTAEAPPPAPSAPPPPQPARSIDALTKSVPMARIIFFLLNIFISSSIRESWEWDVSCFLSEQSVRASLLCLCYVYVKLHLIVVLRRYVSRLSYFLRAIYGNFMLEYSQTSGNGATSCSIQKSHGAFSDLFCCFPLQVY